MHSYHKNIHASERLESRRLLSGMPSLLLHPPSSRSGRAGVEVEFDLGKLTATHASGPFAVHVNWGDGSADTTFVQAKAGRLLPQGHVFSVVGLQTVDVHVTSDSGLTTDETLHIRVLPNTGSITGQVFDDTNATSGQNGSPVDGATVFLDLNRDGQIDTGDPTAVTNAQGVYLFSAVSPGSYILEQSLSAGTDLTTPTAGFSKLAVGFGTVQAKPFGDLTTDNPDVIIIPPVNQKTLANINQTINLGSLIPINSPYEQYSIDVDWGDGSPVEDEGGNSDVALQQDAHEFSHASAKDVVKVTISNTLENVQYEPAVSKQIAFSVSVAANRKPTIIPPAAQRGVIGISQLVKLGRFTTAHTVAPYDIDVNWGDGSDDTEFDETSSGTITPQSHAFQRGAGIDVVKVTMSDSFMTDFKSASFTITLSGGHRATSGPGIALTTVASFGGKALPTGVVSMQVDADGNIFTATSGGGAPAQGIDIGLFTFASGTLFKIRAGAKNLASQGDFSWFDADLGATPIGLVIDHNDSTYLNLFYPGGDDWTSGVTSFDGNGMSRSFPEDLDDTDLPIFDQSDNAYFDSDYQILGGEILGGEVDEIPAGTGVTSTIVNFAPADGDPGYPTPIDLSQDAAGNIYGAAVLGVSDGTSNDPVSLFEIAAQTHRFTMLYNFPQSSASVFFGDLTSDANGNLYGLYGNSLLELPTGASKLTTLATFNFADSSTASILCDPSGNVFVLDPTGGTDQDGEISEVAAITGTLTTVATFDGANGASPFGLISDEAGNLYGLTSSGGSFGAGTAFKIGQGNSTLSTLVDFGPATGVSPSLGLYADGNGNLYGATSIGGPQGLGTIFKIAGTGFEAGTRPSGGISGRVTNANVTGSPGAEGVTVFLDSNGDGKLDSGDESTVTDSAGNFTFEGLPPGNYMVDITGVLPVAPVAGSVSATVGAQQVTGVNFSIRQDSITTLAEFNGPNGVSPGDLAIDASGNLFGGASSDGTIGGGIIFELSAGSSTIQTIATFDYPIDASGSLYVDPSGNIYGTTNLGGQDMGQGGTVFEVSPGQKTQALNTLYTLFDTGLSGIAADAAGNLYGTADSTIFELAAGTHAFETLSNPAESPEGAFAVAPNGNLFTATYSGDLIELPFGASSAEILATGLPGNPTGVAEDSAGNLYVTADNGEVAKVAAGSKAVSYISSPTAGGSTIGPPIIDAAGNLFAITGQSGGGSIVEIPSGSDQIVTLASFSTIIGALPVGNLVADSKGDLFGTTTDGGKDGDGTIFEIKNSGFVPFPSSSG